MNVYIAQAKSNNKTLPTPEIIAVNSADAIRVITQLYPSVSEVKVTEKKRPTRRFNGTSFPEAKSRKCHSVAAA